MCSSLSSVRVAVPPSLLRRYSALPHTVALHVVALLIAVVVVAPILIGSLRGCRRIVPRSSLHSLAVVCAPPLIVVPSLLSGAVLDGTAIPRTCQRFLTPAMLLETGTSTLTGDRPAIGTCPPHSAQRGHRPPPPPLRRRQRCRRLPLTSLPLSNDKIPQHWSL